MSRPDRAPERAADTPLADSLLAEIVEEFPDFRLVFKHGDVFSQVIDAALRAVTLGMQHHYLTRYHTVIGDTLYVPEVWHELDDVTRVILLRHERVHLRQRRRYGLLGMALLYLLPFAPLGLAYGRARLEWEAYEETLRATAELRGLAALRSHALREELCRRFTGPDYGWMWPFPRQVQGWYDAAVTRIEAARDAQHR